jgi:hypothetical protein
MLTISQNVSPQNKELLHSVIGFGFPVLGVVVLSAWGVASDLREAVKNRTQCLKAIEKVPSLVIFKKRSDAITVYPNGDALFEYSHTVAIESDQVKPILHFPVLVDLDQKATEFGRRVQLEDIIVNNVRIPTHGAYTSKEVRHPNPCLPNNPVPTEYGVVSVPVKLGQGYNECDLVMRFRLKGVFTNSSVRDYVIVDIPYMTEELEVRIMPQDANESVILLERMDDARLFIDAYGEMMDMYDHRESLMQSESIRHKNEVIVWRTSMAKLGYRYKLWFRIAKREAG